MTMPTELEQFAIRFEQALVRYCPDNTYLTKAHIIQAMREAVHPPGALNAAYPLRMYLRSELAHYIGVSNAEEEANAAAEGYTRTINWPTYQMKVMIEDPRKKLWDYRGVTLHSEEEEAQWRAAVNVEDWIDDTAHLWGAKGVALGVIVAERKEQLKKLIDADALELVEPDPGNVGPEFVDPGANNTDTESATEETSKES
jgi:hypothetical protein